MRDAPKNRRVRIIGAIVLIPLFVAFGFGIYMANMAGALPWQSDPTRIPVVAFEGLDTGPKIAIRAATPASSGQTGQSTPVASPRAASSGTPVATPTTEQLSISFRND
jgi:hypothetical protein